MGMPALTSLRFFAALAVLLFHFGAGAAKEAGAPKSIVSILTNGYLGVTFFFILSGFILTCAYNNRPRNPTLWADYAIARFSRVYPVYVLGLLLVSPFYFKGQPNPSWQAITLLQSWTLPASRLGTDWNMPAWTLSIELFFYLCFPLLLIGISKFSKSLLFVSAAITAALIAIFNLSAIAPGSTVDGGLAAIPLPILRLPEFLLGIILGQILFSYGGHALPKWASAAMLACALAIVALMASGQHIPGFISLGFAALIVFSAISSGPIYAILSNRFLVLLGGASYAIYLLQMGVHSIVEAAFGAEHQAAARAVFPIALIGVSVVVFIFFEEPARKYIRARLSKLLAPKTEQQPQA